MTDSSKLIEDIFDEIMISLESGNDVKLSSFGTFLIKSKKSRIGRNPKTGVEANINARKVVTFHPSNLIRKKIKWLQYEGRFSLSYNFRGIKKVKIHYFTNDFDDQEYLNDII